MALRLVLRNAAAGSRGTLFAGPFRLVGVNAQPAGEGLLSRELADIAISGRRDLFNSFFSDGFDFHPFTPARPMAQLTPDHFSGSRRMDAPASVSDKGYNLKEDENSLCLKMDMPGLDKDDVKVTLEKNKLAIRAGAATATGEQDTEAAAEEENRRQSYSMDLLLKPDAYKVDGIKAEMKNGVLKVTVPKVQEEEERKDVFNIAVE